MFVIQFLAPENKRIKWVSVIRTSNSALVGELFKAYAGIPLGREYRMIYSTDNTYDYVHEANVAEWMARA